MNTSTLQTVKVYTQILGGLVVAALMFWIPAATALAPIGFLVDIFGLLLNGWALYAFFRYRQGRQDELQRLLATAVEAGLPFAPAVRAYAHDRPQPSKAWVVCRILAFLFLPLYGFIRLCVRLNSYETLLRRFARRLERGEPLSEAMRRVPGVVSRDAMLAASVGEATNTLGPSLRGAEYERLGAVWLGVAPRLLYPFLVFAFVFSISGFLNIVIVPKLRRIFEEFGAALPSYTIWHMDAWAFLEEFALAIAAVQFGALLVLALLIASSTARWNLPVIGRFFRWGAQAQVLRALGQMTGTGRPVPSSLGFLAESADLPRVAQRRLAAAAAAASSGTPLADALHGAGLLPAAMVPLVRSSERAGTLPGALAQLGEHLAGRAFRFVNRLSLVLSPLLVIAVGVVVALIALSMFVPLIHLLDMLSQ